jgi:hypothetical protein
MNISQMKYIVIACLLIVMVFLLFSQSHSRRNVAVFDKGLAIASFANNLNGKNVSQARQKALISKFAAVMPRALESYANRNQLIILNKKTVLSTAKELEVTKDILIEIARTMKTEKSKERL